MWGPVIGAVALWVVVVSAPIGWILGARVGDERGFIGYALSLIAGLAGGMAVAAYYL